MYKCIHVYVTVIQTFIKYQNLLYVIRSLVFGTIFLSPKRILSGISV